MKDTMLIFDLDGTLWDSAKNVASAWNCVLEKRLPQKANITVEDVYSVMGKPMNEILSILFPDENDKERLLIGAECFRYENEYILENGGELFEGVEETLKKLADKGYKMAVVSNCQEGYIPAFFKSMNMRKYFCDYEEWGRTGQSKGENIRLVMERNGFDKAIYIGDTNGDETASRQAGVYFIHAAYGFGEAACPDGVLEKFCALPLKVEEMLR